MGKTTPKDWVDLKFTDILDIKGGNQPPKSKFIDEPKEGYVRLLQIRDFGLKPVPTYIPIIKNQLLCCKDDILIARYGASIGRIVTGMEGSYNVALAKVVIPRTLPKNYIKWYLKSDYFQNPITSTQRTAQNGFNKEDLESVFFPLPPLAEQERIVAKLDALFAQHKLMQKALDRIPQLLKDFRQQVLTKAVKGKLTEEWRKGRDLDEWKIEKSTDCCRKVQSGGTPKGSNFSESGIPFLKVYNIVNNKIDFHYNPQWVSKEIQNSQLKKSIAYSGDIIMNIVGPPLNKIAILTDEFPEWNLNQAITLFRAKDHLINQFLYYFFCEGSSVKTLVNETKGVVGQVNISLSQCREFQISIPPLTEQNEIVARIESLFAKANAIEIRYQKLKAKIASLPQAILHKAFKGELTLQLPTDGDAKDLLAEIMKLKNEVKGKKK